MLFQTTAFLFILFPLFLICLNVIPKGNARAACVLFFSYLFYSGAEPFFVLILVFSSLVDYTAALALSGAKSSHGRKVWLGLSIVVNLGLLSFFKYGVMVLPYLTPVTEFWHLPGIDAGYFKSFALPAGISFYTFQSMSYTIDVYRGRIKPERNLLSYCNYVAYLPQLIAGPIERFDNLHPQLRNLARGLTEPQWTAGLDRLALGLVEKLLIADGCGRIVDVLVQVGGPYPFFSAWALSLGFGMQILFDFAGYCHMAIGISLMLGVRLSENFLSPYQSANIQEFWRRWHVTLSNWFRDYLYIPLGGSRSGLFRTVVNVMITFSLCGLWHGAGWNYVAWGAAHGLLLSIFNIRKRWLPSWTPPRALGVGITFILVHVAWVLFRVNHPDQILRIWKGMFGFSGWQLGWVGLVDLLFIGLVAAVTLLAPNASRRWPGRSGGYESIFWWGAALWALFSSPQINQFIYFQF